MITCLGPSKTEMAAGFRLGVAVGTEELINRMAILQSIVSLRCASYNQSVFRAWFNEPEGWLEERHKQLERIHEALLRTVASYEGVSMRPAEGGSYAFIKIPELKISIGDFVRSCKESADAVIEPGTKFGPKYTRHFRINFAQDYEKCIGAVDRILKIAKLYRR